MSDPTTDVAIAGYGPSASARPISLADLASAPSSSSVSAMRAFDTTYRSCMIVRSR